jgi:hypothetical protein
VAEAAIIARLTLIAFCLLLNQNQNLQNLFCPHGAAGGLLVFFYETPQRVKDGLRPLPAYIVAGSLVGRHCAPLITFVKVETVGFFIGAAWWHIFILVTEQISALLKK